MPDHRGFSTPAPEELALRKEETAAPEGAAGTRTGGGTGDAGEGRDVIETGDAGEAHKAGESSDGGQAPTAQRARDAEEVHRTGERNGPGTAEAIPLRGSFAELTPQELALTHAEEAARSAADTRAATVRVPGATAHEKHDTRFPMGETVPIDHRTGRPGRPPATVREDSDAAYEAGRTPERSGEAGRTSEMPSETGETSERFSGTGKTEEPGTAAGEAPRLRTAEGGEFGRDERPAEAIPERGMPFPPAPEELAHRTEETASPEGEAGTRTVGEARPAGEARDTGEGRHTEEVRGAGEVRPTIERFGPGAAEAIPLRGAVSELTPQELALAYTEEAAQPGTDSKTGAARRAAAREKRDTHSPNGERVSIDDRIGRPGRTPGAVREDSGEMTGEAGRGSDRSGGAGRVSGDTGETGRAGEHKAAEEPVRRAVTAEAPEAGRVERPADAIPGPGEPHVPAPEELAFRQEQTAVPEGGAVLSPGSTAKRLEAFAESIAEKVRRAERPGLRTGGRDRGPLGADLRRLEASPPGRESTAGAVNFSPPVEMTGAAESPRGPESASVGTMRTARGSRAEYSPESLAYGSTTSGTAGETGPDGAAHAAVREVRRALRPAERVAGGGAATGPAPVELAYGGPGGTGEARPAEQPKAQSTGDTGESDYVKSLPDWARRFLKEGARSLGTAGSMAVTAIPDLGTAQDKKPQMVEWTAPGFRQQPPAETQLKELKPPEDTGGQTGEVRISDAEIRRTADKVYKIIEDRIRRERRRLGL